jgi:hypothetical protein
MWNLFTPALDLIGLYCYQVFFLSILATIALIRFDRFKIPPRLAFFTLAMGVSLRWVWPDLCVVPSPDWLSSSASVVQLNGRLPANLSVERALYPLFDVLIGFCAGILAQTAINRSHRIPRPNSQGITLALSLTAVYCGSLAIGWVFFLTALLQLLSSIIGRANSRSTYSLWTMMSLIGAWLTLCFWRPLSLVEAGQFASPWTFTWVLFAIGLGTACVAEWIQWHSDLPTDHTSDAAAPNAPSDLHPT